MTFEATDGNVIQSTVVKKDHDGPELLLGSVTVYGVMSRPKTVTVNGKAAEFEFDAVHKVSVFCVVLSLLNKRIVL